MSLRALRTAVGCPWQNGVAERWVGNCRRELLDHVIAINESHLKRLLASYVEYYHQDRTHCGLQKQTPQTRTRFRPREGDIVVSCRRSSSSLRTRRLRMSPSFSQGAYLLRDISRCPSLNPSCGFDWELLAAKSLTRLNCYWCVQPGANTCTEFWPMTPGVDQFRFQRLQALPIVLRGSHAAPYL
jgi:hypothetical protein